MLNNFLAGFWWKGQNLISKENWTMIKRVRNDNFFIHLTLKFEILPIVGPMKSEIWRYVIWIGVLWILLCAVNSYCISSSKSEIQLPALNSLLSMLWGISLFLFRGSQILITMPEGWLANLLPTLQTLSYRTGQPKSGGWGAYLKFVIFSMPPHFFACKLYARKVRKFATKTAARQNSVN